MSVVMMRSMASPSRESLRFARSFRQNFIKVGCGKPCLVHNFITEGWPIALTNNRPTVK